MDFLHLPAKVLRRLIAGARNARIHPATAMSDLDIANSAHGLVFSLLATRWQRKNKAPSWPSVYQQWLARLPADGTPTLYGSFDADDRLELLTDNAAAFAKRLELYQTATQSIDISTYYIQADDAGWSTARALADCARRGIRVRIVADRCATAQKNFGTPELRDMINFLRDAGVDYRLFHTPGRPYDVNHRKLLIIDKKTAILGGRNYADHYAGSEWRDIELLLEGPSAAHLQLVFEETFAGRPDLHKRNSLGSLVQPTAPTDISSNAYFVYLLECIRASKHTLDIEHGYYFNHDAIHRELTLACRRGVRVRVFTNSAESIDLSHMSYRLYAGFPDLLDAGVQLYLRRGLGRTLHSKYFVADGVWIGFGSSNLDYYSPRFCLELGLQVRDVRFGQMLTSWFEQGIAEADLIQDRAEIDRVLAAQTVGKYFDRWLQDMQ